MQQIKTCAAINTACAKSMSMSRLFPPVGGMQSATNVAAVLGEMATKELGARGSSSFASQRWQFEPAPARCAFHSGLRVCIPWVAPCRASGCPLHAHLGEAKHIGAHASGAPASANTHEGRSD